MKAKLLVLALLLAVLTANAQTIDVIKDGSYYSLVSPNGKYYAGHQDGAPAFLYDLEAKTTKMYEPEDMHGYYITAVSNSGNMYGSKEMLAAYCKKNEEKWEHIAMPDSMTEADLGFNTIAAVSEDEKNLVVSFSMEPLKHYYYTDKGGGEYDMEQLPVPDKDPVYRMKPQWIKITDMSLDGTKIAGMYLTSDGQRHLPLIWEKDEAGKWSYRFLATDILLQEGKTIPPYPYEYEDPEEGIPYEIWDKWITERDNAESGYYYRLFGIGMSGNGKYLSLNVGLQMPGEAYGTMHGGVIDTEKDTLYVFASLHDASCFSVSDEGVAMLGTPSVEYFRWGFAGNINNPDTVVTLRNWIMEKTSGKIDLADHMTYQINENGTRAVAEGSACMSKHGNAILTMQNNLLETGQWECFLITLDGGTAIEQVETEKSSTIYPNPTTGMTYTTKELKEVRIYDIAGREVYSAEKITTTIDLTSLEKGQYIIKARTEGRTITEKLIIK